MRHYCTYFDHNYLPRGIVTLESLFAHCPEAFVHVLCLSDTCRDALQRLAYPNVSLLSLAELEAADEVLASTKHTRSLVEYYFTLTPCLPWHLLARSGLREVTYLDADMMFFASPEALFAEAGDASVIITPHRFSPALAELEKFGKYNVSWMTFRDTADGLDCLAWYREACLEWCCDTLEEGRFADQKYLDAFPEKFSGVHAMRHPGGGVAPWNVASSRFAYSNETFTVDGYPLIFYHAQGFKHIVGRWYASGLLPFSANLRDPVLQRLLREYAGAYSRAEARAVTLTGKQDFSGIRFKKNDSLVFLRQVKRAAREFFHNTAVYRV